MAASEPKSRRPRNGHSHMWVVGVGGVAVGAAMMVFLPQMKIATWFVLLEKPQASALAAGA